ncbi:major facilitator transporter-like protein [Favolaschia claudopus]|uniref:Major facilitator transporter-like protein n=1 Tax=Favolaschia claudopus TaxID=2862362 RepID=A0AAW0CWJ4_9AGAR
MSSDAPQVHLQISDSDPAPSDSVITLARINSADHPEGEKAKSSFPKPLNSASTLHVHSSEHDEKAETPAVDPDTILRGRKLALAFVAMLMSLLPISLDQTILATALPRIASDFNNFSLQGWVSTSFILAQTVFLLFYGQMLRIYSAKWVLIVSVVVFEAGSLVCALAQNINAIIAGRTVSGVGSAGIFVAILQIIAQSTLLEDRPRLFACFGAVLSISSVVGPLIGGALTDSVSWRWCFYINLPLGGVSLLGAVFVLKTLPPMGSDPTKRTRRDIWQQTLRLDYVGATLVAGSVTSLILALQWGGNTKLWSDKAVIISFVFAGVVAAMYVFWVRYMGERGMTPTAIFKTRSVWAILVYSFFMRFALLLFAYYIPIFYQSVRHHSATKSGIDLLPFQLSVIITDLVGGVLVGHFGYYWPFLFGGTFFLAVGSGLFYTVGAASSTASLIGYQILIGIGSGMGTQNSLLAMQVEFRDAPELVAQATSMGSFASFLGGTVGLGVAEPVFASELTRYLLKFAPEAPAAIVKESPTAIWELLEGSLIAGVVRSYTQALRVVFVLGVPVAGLGLMAVMMIKNIRIEKTEGVRG